MPQDFNCPHCGAPLDLPTGDAPTITCPYCHTSVVVPEELRSQPKIDESGLVKKGLFALLLVNAPFILLPLGILACVGVSMFLITQTVNHAVSSAIPSTSRVVTVAARPTRARAESEATLVAPPTAAPTRTRPAPTATPTPGFMQATLRFGSKGLGGGEFNSSTHIAVDNQGQVYVSDAQGGRIQAFDEEGNYLNTWSSQNSQTNIHSISVDGKGILYVVADNQIERLDTVGGKSLDPLEYVGGDGFDWVTATADGRLLAMWYDIQNGRVTDTNGHKDELVQFDANGKVVKTTPAFVASQTGHFTYDVRLAVDGQGTIYALDRVEEAVLKFNRDGKFVTRIGSRGQEAGQYQFPMAITVDSQSRVYVADSKGIQVFDSNGRYLDMFGSEGTIWDMAFDRAGRLWVLGVDHVTRYEPNTK